MRECLKDVSAAYGQVEAAAGKLRTLRDDMVPLVAALQTAARQADDTDPCQVWPG